MFRPLGPGLLVALAMVGCVGVVPSHADKIDLHVARTINEALSRYLRGDGGAAADLLHEALKEMGAHCEQGEWRPEVPDDATVSHSNAGELLDYLSYYREHAYGQRPGLDAAYEYLTSKLALILRLNRTLPRQDRVDGVRISYDISTNFVDEIGDIHIDYDISHRKITRVGDYRIEYDIQYLYPKKIGGIEFDHSISDQTLEEVAGVRID